MEQTSSNHFQASVVDLFCGVGGLTHGFRQEGFSIVAGIDTDESCKYPFEYNNHAPFIHIDVSKLSGNYLRNLYIDNSPTVLVGCAPCQPFSSYNQKQGVADSKWQLLQDFGRLITETQPDVVSMENVPRLVDFREGEVFNQFISTLKTANYYVSWGIVYAPDYGIPQNRSRLILLASRYAPIELPKATHNRDRHQTVREAIEHLPEIGAGEIDENDPLHRSARLSSLNLQRIRASIPGGTWRDWPEQLVANCHQSKSGQGYKSVYGRMVWDEPSPTITTQFYGYGNGRFGHPNQDRGLSLREGAILQTFPEDYLFIPPGEEINLKTLGRMIGNAVPVRLGKVVAGAIKTHLIELGLGLKP